MAATKQDIAAWFDRGVKEGATHMIIVCDTYDYSDYPVFVNSHENVREKEWKYHFKDMQQVMEVYNLSISKEKQLAERRAFHYD